MIRRVIVVCNAMDDGLRMRRSITTDSPAASRKVFHLCIALRRAGVEAVVLSLGRGRANGSMSFFASEVRRVQGVPVIYSPFSSARGISEMLSLMAPAMTVFRLRKREHTAIVFYNRELAYLPTLMVAALRRFKCVLDLEDGEVGGKAKGIASWISRSVQKIYDRLCKAGALLACSALAERTRARPVMCYYGTAESSGSTSRWSSDTVNALLGGTLAPDTGVDLLVATIQTLRQAQPAWASRLHFHVTGKGPSLETLKLLATDRTSPQVSVHGRTTDDGYRNILEQCEVGLALKPTKGLLANTTFPSKVIELASAGLLVLTTDISDVRAVLGEGALYLKQDDPVELVEQLRWVIENKHAAQSVAQQGQCSVWMRCSPIKAGMRVSSFIFGASE